MHGQNHFKLIIVFYFPFPFSFVGPKMALKIFLSKTLKIVSSDFDITQVSEPYASTGLIKVLHNLLCLFTKRRTIIKKHKVIHVRCPLFLSDFNETWIFLADFSKNTQISNFMIITPAAAKCFFAQRQTDARDVTYDGFLHVIFLCRPHALYPPTIRRYYIHRYCKVTAVLSFFKP